MSPSALPILLAGPRRKDKADKFLRQVWGKGEQDGGGGCPGVEKTEDAGGPGGIPGPRLPSLECLPSSMHDISLGSQNLGGEEGS